MNRLGVKLMGAFVIVILIGMLVTVLVARQAAATQLSHFMVGNAMIRPALLQQAAADYYAANDSWEGVETRLPELLRRAADGGTMGDAMGGMMSGMMGGMADSRVRIVDERNVVVADTAGTSGELLEREPVGDQLPIRLGNRLVGTLVIDGALMTMTTRASPSLLAGLTRAVAVAATVAGLVGLVLASLFIRQITGPVIELSKAAHRISAGDLSTRVPPRSNDEIGDLARSFNQMAAALEAQEQLRRNLMADVAHELRTPLAGIQGTVEALQDGVFPLTPDNLAPIHDQTLLLNRLVEDLRTLALADAGELTLTVEPVNLSELSATAVDSFRARARAAQVTLRHVEQGTGEAVSVAGDRARLHQVVTNLLDNALRYTRAGDTITVTARVANYAEGNWVQWRVTDTGRGMAQAELDHIFDRFYRIDDSRSRLTGGSGLGLAIVKQIVTAHGGTVRAASPPSGQERGAEFTVLLPVAPTCPA